MHLFALEVPVLLLLMLGGGWGGMWNAQPDPSLALFTPVPFTCAPPGDTGHGGMLRVPNPLWEGPGGAAPDCAGVPVPRGVGSFGGVSTWEPQAVVRLGIRV